MGIGCRRDALEANVWYVRAADQGDDRAKHRIAAIRAAATGTDPVTAALPDGGARTKSGGIAGKIGPGKRAAYGRCNAFTDRSGGYADTEKTKKRFGIF